MSNDSVVWLGSGIWDTALVYLSNLLLESVVVGFFSINQELSFIERVTVTLNDQLGSFSLVNLSNYSKLVYTNTTSFLSIFLFKFLIFFISIPLVIYFMFI